ncbi:LOW QUALITY PROTEIN: hypothetical protein QYF61_020401 [Mycteria americana]|uniref:Uncharacterized protein n=1 Tax=Mycteria americana TaxID=33587 RepID=A0AAN7S335_MYCAM|nr:LOW QUALITY PROTEIN: hypothetical protein QYF61_020401 [Mycteria americana]
MMDLHPRYVVSHFVAFHAKNSNAEHLTLQFYGAGPAYPALHNTISNSPLLFFNLSHVHSPPHGWVLAADTKNRVGVWNSMRSRKEENWISGLKLADSKCNPFRSDFLSGRVTAKRKGHSQVLVIEKPKKARRKEASSNPPEDLDRLEEWANKNLMKFSKDKCRVLHLGKHNPGGQHRLGSTQLGSSSVERDLGVLVDNKLKMSEPCAAVAKKANRMLGASTRASPAEIKKSLSHSTQLLPHLEYCVLFWSLLRKKDVDRMERVQRRATKMIKGLGSLPYVERLGELGLFSLEKRRLRGDLITTFQYLKGGYKEDEDSLFTRSHMEKTRGNGYKLILGRFQLGTRGKFFTDPELYHLMATAAKAARPSHHQPVLPCLQLHSLEFEIQTQDTGERISISLVRDISVNLYNAEKHAAQRKDNYHMLQLQRNPEHRKLTSSNEN